VEFFAQLLEPIDISLGGLRICAHQPHPLGSILRLDLFFPHAAPVTITAQVTWSQALSESAPARFVLGLAFVGVHPDVVDLLQTWLGPERDAGPRESMVEQVRGPTDSSVQYRQAEPSGEVRRATSEPPPSTAGPRRDSPSILSTIPVVVVDPETLGTLQVGRAGFLLWLIDGFMTVETILELAGRPAEETLTVLEDLLERGIIKLRWSTLSSRAAPTPQSLKVKEPEVQTPTSASAILGAIQPSPVSKKTHNPVTEMRECFSRGDYEGALGIVDLLLAVQPDDALAREFRASCCLALEDVYALRLGPLDRIPLVVTLPEPTGGLGIDRARILLSMMDGASTLETILNVCEMPRLDALRTIQKLVQSRNIAFK